jgi:hypothetical protein
VDDHLHGFAALTPEIIIKNAAWVAGLSRCCGEERILAPAVNQTSTSQLPSPSLVTTLTELIFSICVIYIVTCRVVRVMKITGSNSDDYIYQHLGYKFS